VDFKERIFLAAVISVGLVLLTDFWDAAPRSLVETDRRFRGAYCLHHHGSDGGSKHL
jgi:hypothetical protein